jgi:predicted nuclease of predicted toxin-antitoxin system
MRFLIDASLPRSTAPLAKNLGDDAVDVRDLGMGAAPDPDIAAYAQSQQLCLLTRDYDFADIRNYPPDQYFGLVVIELPATATVPVILNLVEALLRQRDLLALLPGRLAIVEPGRVRLRPAP